MSFSALLIRSMGMMFRVFLTDTIGAEGIGLYQLIMSVYLVFASVSTAGISLCATRLFGDFYSAGKISRAKYSVERCILMAFLSGVILSTIMFLASDIFANYLLNEKRTAPALRLLAPSLPFMAVSACIRGYFVARRKTLQTSGEQILEQIIEMGVFIFVFSYYRPSTLEASCTAAVFGTSAAEFVSFIYSILCYRLDIKRFNCRSERVNSLFRLVMPVALPVTANAALRSGLSAAENALIPYGLKRYGSSDSNALAQYGIISGMSMTVLVFPSVFIIPFAMLIVPEIAEAVVLKHNKGIKHMTEKMVSITLLYSIPVTVCFIFFAVPLCNMIFGNEQAGTYLAVLAPVVPLMYMDSVVDGILKGLNEQTSYLIFNTIDSAVRVLLTYILLPHFGIYGVIAVIIISELLNTFLSVARLIKITSFRLCVFDDIIRPLICILIPCLFLRLLPESDVSGGSSIIKIIIAILFYLLAVKYTKISRTES